jgi:phosphoribosylaminoimidazole-succinocarboxamide synthase
VPVDDALLRQLCHETLTGTDFTDCGTRIEGKVRDSYVSEKHRTIVVSDRVSCFDVVVGTIPLKGQVLNQLAAFWFEKTRGIAPNHLLSVPDPNVSVVKEVEILPIEFIMRGYLTGVSSTSIWTAYERGDAVYCGHPMPKGMRKHQELPAPMLTPTTKAEQGEHDELISRQEIIERGILDADTYDGAGRIAARLFAEGQAWARQQGLLLVDTKYEIGLAEDGSFVVADEIHTPDSSRYWYADAYPGAMAAGEDPKALDKEYVRRWLVSEHGYRGDGPPPELPDDVRCEAARRYIQAYEQITGQPFEPDTEAPVERIRRNLGL